MGGIKDFIGGIAGKTGADIITSVGNVVDQFVTTPEEKEKMKLEITKEVNRNMEAMQTAQNAELETLMKDTADARNREVQIVTSDKAPVLNKVITPILALIIVLLTFAMWWAVLYKEFKNGEKDIILFILGSLSTMCAGVISYFFGSSQGSARKQDVLDKMMK